MKGKAVRYGLKGLNWGSNIALALVLTAIVAVLIAPHVTGWRYGILRSGSMSPAMPTGAAIVVAPVGAADVRPHDVITYRSIDNWDLLITHRVVSVESEGGKPRFVTQGDANATIDHSVVTSDRLVGRVIYDVPYVGRISQALRSEIAFILLIGLPTALIILLELKELFEGVKDLRRGKKRGENVGNTIAE